MAKPKESKLWDGIYESHFIDDKHIEPVDIADYDKSNMTLYAANINLWRQLIRLSDSLKPVERRILYVMYQSKFMNGNKSKSALVAGSTMVYHGHGDASIYASMVGMTQSWKKQCPLLIGKGNFGNAARPEMYASARYTEISISKYAKECFFDDYDDDCVETVFNSTSDLNEPMSLPAKFPNILINGGLGIAFGNSFCIPTYNINDIIEVCKKVIDNPDTANVFMIPDLPSGCTIINDGDNFRNIINTGKGVLKMRADAEIIDAGRYWILKFTNLPWMMSLSNIEDKIVSLVEAGVISIKDKQDHSYAIKNKDGTISTQVDFRLLIDKSHDPQTILEKLYTTTDLQKSISIDFKAVLDNLTVKRLNMRDLVISWLNERRSYKRRLFNKRLTKLSARIDLLKILIYLLKSDNIEKTIKIIKSSRYDDIPSNLRRLTQMSSYQAHRIADMRLGAFNADARAKYIEEKNKLEIECEDLLKLIRSEKRIDKLISEELDDLRKYAKPRKSRIVNESTTKHIADTYHSVIISKDNFLKKLAYDKNYPARSYNMGSFKSGDYPVHQRVVHNASSITLFDSFGRYSVVNLYDIDSTEHSQYGHKVFDLSKLSGKIIKCNESFDDDVVEILRKNVDEPYLLTISKNGYGKKTRLEVFTDLKNKTNLRAMKIRDDDSLAIAEVVFNNSLLLIYTKKGQYTILKAEDIAEQNKDSMGLITIRVSDDDEVIGFTVIGPEDKYVTVVSAKGMVMKVPVNLFGRPNRRGNIKDQGSMMTLDSTDSISFAAASNDDQILTVAIRNNVLRLDMKDIPELLKKNKGKKMLALGHGFNIVVAAMVDK